MTGFEIAIKTALHHAFHNSRRPAKEIAQRMDVEYNYLARAVLTGSSGCNFPIHWIRPFIKAAGTYQALKVLVNACGYLLVRNPKAFKNVNELRMTIHHFQKRFLAAVDALIDCVNDPSMSNCELAVERLTTHQEETEYWKRMIKHKNIAQLELGF